MTIKRHEFKDSSMLSSCEYNTDEKELSVQFVGGRIYTYVDVPEECYDGLITAKSAGKYFNSIKAELKMK